MRLGYVLTLGIGLSCLVFSGCTPKGGMEKANLETDEGKYSYAIGHQIAKNMKMQKLKIDIGSFYAAVKETMDGGKLQMTEEDMRTAMRRMSEMRREGDSKTSEENKTKGAAFLEENMKKSGVKVTDSKLQYLVLKEGTGAMPSASDTVEVHYKGTLIDGTEFDSSYKRNKPAEFPVKAVIPGWTEGLQLMKVGSKFQFVIPSELGYGGRGTPSIPGNSVLVFEVELISIKGSKKADSKKTSKKAKK